MMRVEVLYGGMFYVLHITSFTLKGGLLSRFRHCRNTWHGIGDDTSTAREGTVLLSVQAHTCMRRVSCVCLIWRAIILP